VKELVVLGVLASHGLQYGVEAHMRRAIAYGATKEELFEAIKAAGPGGGVAYSVGAGRSKHWARRAPCRRSSPPDRRGASAAPRRRSPAHPKPRHDVRYVGVHLSRPYTVSVVLPSNEAT
jgi:AhpD family alkylhydroperoxidase